MNQTDTPVNSIYLCSPVNALVEGLYEQKVPFTRIKKHGDFGLGTFDNLDGEMVMLDGIIYQITSMGKVNLVEETALTPFVSVTFYRPMSHDRIENEMTYEAFLEWLKGLFPSPNIFYAVRIEGEFSYIKTRSVPKQENYRPLVEVAKEQPVFTFENISGTLAGFFTPEFMGSISVPGLHLHFLSSDLRHGGHLLECRPKNAVVGVQLISSLELGLPISLDYLTVDFKRDTTGDLDKAEK
ncbi:MAG: acetolactate decarboxylase [Nitrospirae bacterium]|nr:acetolactate decarboxylase [Nitrospirota bacterium]